MSGRSRDTRTQAVKSLPARPHSAGHHVREELRHTFTGGQIPAGQTALGRSPCQGGAATHVHSRSNPCRPDRTRQVTMSGRSRDTRTQAVKSLPARPHSAGRRIREEPRHIHRRSNPCRPDHTQLVTVSGRSRDTYTGGHPCRPDHTQLVTCQGGAVTQIHMWPTLLARSHSLKYCKLTSLDASSSKELYITTTTLS